MIDHEHLCPDCDAPCDCEGGNKNIWSCSHDCEAAYRDHRTNDEYDAEVDREEMEKE